MDDLHSRMGRVETHVEYMREDVRELHGKVDLLLAKPSTLAQVAGFVAQHWKPLLVLVITVAGGASAQPLLALLK